MQWSDVVKLLALSDEEKNTRHVMFFGGGQNPLQFAQHLCHLANHGGGQMVVGIDLKNHHLNGSKLSSDEFRTLSKNFIEPLLEPLVDEVKRNERRVLIVSVNPDEKMQSYFVKTNLIPVDFNSGSITVAIDETKLAQVPSPPLPGERGEGVRGTGHPSIAVRHFIPTPGARKRQEDVWGYLQINGSITNRQYRDMFQVSHKTAHLELMDLVANQKIEARGAGRSAFYQFPNWVAPALPTIVENPDVEIAVSQVAATAIIKAIAAPGETFLSEPAGAQTKGFDPFVELEVDGPQEVPVTKPEQTSLLSFVSQEFF